MSARRSGVLAALTVAALLAVAAPAAASIIPAPATAVAVAAAEPPGVSYVTHLRAAADDLAPQGSGVAAALAEITAAEEVAPSSRTVLDPVAAALRTDPPDVAGAQGTLLALARVLAYPNGAASSDPTAPERALHDVYSRPVFAGLDRPPPRNFLDVLGDAVGRLVGGAANRLGVTGSILLGAVVLALVLAVAALALRRVSAGRVARTAPLREALPTADPDAEWRAAEAAAARGDHREAVRRAFRSALLATALRGRVAVDASWTTRELLDHAAGDADLVAALAPAAASFDVAWYSRRPVTAADWETARARCLAVLHLAGRRVGVR